MKSIVEGTYEPPERVVGGLPPVIAGCIRKALAVDPAERFQDCATFREALENAFDAGAQSPQKPSRSYAVTQVEKPPAPEPDASAYAPTYVPDTGRLPKSNTPPPAPAPPAPAPVAPAPIQRAPVNTVRVSPKDVARASPAAVSRSTGSPGVAVVLNLFCLSGGGQLYNGQTAKGVLGLIASLFVLKNIITGGGPGGACLWLTWYIAFIVDAYRIASKLQSGKHVGPWELF